MDQDVVAAYITTTFPGVETEDNLGYTFFYFGADHRRAFATIARQGNEYEKVSDLSRPGVYRLNIGVSRDTFQSLFGSASVDLSGYDFTALDVIMPHPDYAKQFYICVLSPSDATWERVRELLREAYDIVVQKASRKAETG